MTIETMHWMGSMGAMNFFAGPAVDQVKWREIRNGSYGQTIVHREPIGVVGAIVAWNVPLFLGDQQARPRAAGRLHGGAQAGRRNPSDRKRFG